MSVTAWSVQELNRALLARQGLLEPLDVDVVSALETVGAVQAQQWTSPPVALWSRVARLTVADLHAALAERRLVAGTLLRGTLHLVSAAEHAAYAAVVELAGHTRWDRGGVELPAESARLRPALRAFCALVARTDAQLGEFIESWLAANPGAIPAAEVAWQREHGWRPLRTTPDLIRVPERDQWAKAPKLSLAAQLPPRPVDQAAALVEVTRRHLRAFGPATADDVAYWTGVSVPRARAALDGQDDLAHGTDPAGRTLYDLAGAPRPAGDTPAPPRFLAAFDSALLAYHAGRRDRILPPALKGAVYVGANLRIKPTFLVDGLVAGTWATTGRRASAELTLTAATEIDSAPRRRAIEAEGERLLAFLHPGATPTITWD